MGYLFTTIGRIFEGAIVSVGSHMTLSLGGILLLGFPAAFWGGAYGYAIAAQAGLGLPVAFLIGMGMAMVIGALFAFFYTRMSNDSFAVITLASVLALDALIRSWSSLTGGVLGIAGVPRPEFASTLKHFIVIDLVVALIALGFEALLVSSPFGRSLRALKENKLALTSLGTSANLVGQVALLFAALFAGITGILTTSRIQFLDPSLGGFVLLVQILTIAIVANKPDVLRLLGATVVIILIPEALRFADLPVLILGYIRNLLYAAILILILYYVMYTSPIKRNV